MAKTMPASTATQTCSEVALLCGTSARASSMVRREPYQYAPLAWPISSTPSSSMPEVISSIISRLLSCISQFLPASSCTESTASSQGW